MSMNLAEATRIAIQDNDCYSVQFTELLAVVVAEDIYDCDS
jgi:hypothetical protein